MLVYEHSESVSCQKLRMKLVEKAIDYEIRNRAREAGEQVSPAFLAIDQKEVVPLIRRERRTITGPSIIVAYREQLQQ